MRSLSVHLGQSKASQDDMKGELMQMIPTVVSGDLIQFAYFANPWADLNGIAALTYPEKWFFKNRHENCVPDIEPMYEYLKAIHSHVFADIAMVFGPNLNTSHLCITETHLYYHTGLYDDHGAGIYMLFSRNNHVGVPHHWIFEQALPEGDVWLEKHGARLRAPSLGTPEPFRMDWKMNMIYDELILDQVIGGIVSGEYRWGESFRDLLGYQLIRARTAARDKPGHFVPIWHEGSIHYAMPMFLASGSEAPDCALLLEPRNRNRYIGCKALTMRETFHMARVLGPVQARWLDNLVRRYPPDLIQSFGATQSQAAYGY